MAMKKLREKKERKKLQEAHDVGHFDDGHCDDGHFDDGHTIANMNVEGIRGYIPDREERDRRRREENGLHLTRRELRAMIFGAMRALLPFFIGFALIFSLVYWLIYWWLMSVR